MFSYDSPHCIGVFQIRSVAINTLKTTEINILKIN